MRKAIAALLAEEPAPGRQGRRRIPAG